MENSCDKVQQAGTIEISVNQQSKAVHGHALSASMSVYMSITDAYLLKILCDLTVVIFPVLKCANAMIQHSSNFQTIPVIRVKKTFTNIQSVLR